MKTLIEWIRRLWEQPKAPEPSPHPDVKKRVTALRLAWALALLTACGDGAGGEQVASDAAVVEDGSVVEQTADAGIALQDDASPAELWRPQLTRNLAAPVLTPLPELVPQPPLVTGPGPK